MSSGKELIKNAILPKVMYKYFRQRNIVVILLILLGIALSIIPAAATSSTITGTVIQSYNAGPSVLPSMIVESQSKDKTIVTPLSSNDMDNMLGVVISSANATIVLAPQNPSAQQVLVAPSGRYNVLVSNQNGSINPGDYLTISNIPGVAMKADTVHSLVIGKAVNSFNGNNRISTVSLKNSQNGSENVAVGRIVANVQLAPNPLYLKNSNSVLVFLTRAEYNVTNKPVSSLRTYLVAMVFLATILITIVVLYTGVRSSMIAIGRNPLAKSAISGGLVRTIFAGIIVFATGTATVYLILNR